MENFSLNWRFNEEKYDKLPDLALDELKPLDKEASNFVADFIFKTNLHTDTPFKKDLFNRIEKASITKGNEKEIKAWLYHRGLPLDKPVFLSWDVDNAMIVPWKLVIKFFDSFYYSSSDDLTVIDESLNWALIFLHYGEIYFGTNKDFIPSETSDNERI